MADEREERFVSQLEDIVIVSRQPGPRTLLTIEEVNNATQRVADGEDPELVAEDVAIAKVANEELPS